MGAGVVLVAVAVLLAGRKAVERGGEPAPAHGSADEAEAVLVGDMD
jgi:hypothetical protein